MINSMCFILSPSEQHLFNPEQSSIPSIALGVLSGFLTEKGLKVGLYDLNTNFRKNICLEEVKNLMQAAYDKESVLSYLKGEENADIEKLMNWLLKDINLESYDCVGCSIGGDFSLLQVHIGFLTAKYVQKKFKKEIMIGGNNITYLYLFKDIYKELWQTALSQFPIIIKGAGEQAIWDLIGMLNAGQTYSDIKNVKGLVQMENGDIKANQEYTPVVVRPNWDSLDVSYYKRNLLKNENENCVYIYKWPDWISELVYKHNGTKRDDCEKKLVLPYFFNYNCPYNCAFCTQSDYDRGQVINAEVEKTVEDLICLSHKYDTKYFYFLNNAFNSFGRFADELCLKLIEKKANIYWSDCARVNNMTYERLKLMRYAGCRKLVFGFESGSKKILDLVHKNLDLDKTEQVLKWCHELGIWAEVEVIIGLPHEEKEDFMDTYNFISKNSKYINHFWLNEFFVVPNSLIGRHPERYDVELIRNKSTYADILQSNYKDFMRNECEFTKNARLFGFNEINGRNYSEISEGNKRKILKLSSLQNKEFSMVHRFYSMMASNG